MRCASRAQITFAQRLHLKLCMTVVFLCFASSAHARTWGAKPFENDAAVSWLGDLRASGVDSIVSALKRVNDDKGQGQVPADNCSIAIAAASVVAAAKDGSTELLDSDAAAWLQSSGFKPDGKLTKQAKTAVATCRGASRSELYMYWMGMTNAPAWIDLVKALLKRLEG
jgi:hypothetical protein